MTESDNYALIFVFNSHFSKKINKTIVEKIESARIRFKKNVKKNKFGFKMQSFVSPHHGHDPMHSGIMSTASMTSSGVPPNTGPQPITAQEAIEVAGRNVEKMIHGDSQFPSLAEKLRLGK